TDELGRQGRRDFRTGKLAGRAQPDLEEGLIQRLELFDEQRDSARLTGQNGAARRLQNVLLGNIRLSDQVVEGGGFVSIAGGQQTLGTKHAAFGDGRSYRNGRAGQRRLERLRGGGISNAPQGHRCGRCRFGVRILQSRAQKFDGGGVLANANRVDY